MSTGANLVWSKVNGGKAYVRFNATGYVNTVANSTVNCDIGNPGNEQVIGATITGVWWSTPGGNSTANYSAPITIKRGSNTVMVLAGTGVFNTAQGWPGEIQYPFAANVVVTFADASSTLYLELHKVYANQAANASF